MNKYFSVNGYKSHLTSSVNWSGVLNTTEAVMKGIFYEKNKKLLQFFEYDLKKGILSFIVGSKMLEIRRGKRGVNIIITFRFFRNNLRVSVFLENYGFILFSTTGGIVAKKVLRTSKVYRRDKKGDGTLNYIGVRIKRKIRKCLRRFYIARIKLYLASYFRRYMFFRLIKRFIFKRLRRQVYIRIPRGHNSLESSKRWRKKRRK